MRQLCWEVLVAGNCCSFAIAGLQAAISAGRKQAGQQTGRQGCLTSAPPPPTPTPGRLQVQGGLGFEVDGRVELARGAELQQVRAQDAARAERIRRLAEELDGLEARCIADEVGLSSPLL